MLVLDGIGYRQTVLATLRSWWVMPSQWRGDRNPSYGITLNLKSANQLVTEDKGLVFLTTCQPYLSILSLSRCHYPDISCVEPRGTEGKWRKVSWFPFLLSYFHPSLVNSIHPSVRVVRPWERVQSAEWLFCQEKERGVLGTTGWKGSLSVFINYVNVQPPAWKKIF